MRIRGSGSGFTDSGRGSKRSDSFKKGKQVGQKVRGKVLKWVSEDMAWVLIDGHKLLANLPPGPAVGALLTFVIVRLKPEIVLKALSETMIVGDGNLNLASAFETARTLFENNYRPHTTKLSIARPQDRLSRFVNILGKDDKLLTLFIDTVNCAQAINSHISSTTPDRICYQPWLLPEGWRHITLIRGAKAQTSEPQLAEILMEADMESLGMVRIKFMHKPPVTGYKLKVQHPARNLDLKRYLTSRAGLPDLGRIDCLGVGKLPQSGHGGILSELMFSK